MSHLWLVDPLLRSLEVHRLEGRRWNRQRRWSGEATVHAEPFAVLPFELATHWAPVTRIPGSQAAAR